MIIARQAGRRPSLRPAGDHRTDGLVSSDARKRCAKSAWAGGDLRSKPPDGFQQPHGSGVGCPGENRFLPGANVSGISLRLRNFATAAAVLRPMTVVSILAQRGRSDLDDDLTAHAALHGHRELSSHFRHAAAAGERSDLAFGFDGTDAVGCEVVHRITDCCKMLLNGRGSLA